MRDLPEQTQPQLVRNSQIYIKILKNSGSSRKLDASSQISTIGLQAFPMNLDIIFLNHVASFPTSNVATYSTK